MPMKRYEGGYLGRSVTTGVAGSTVYRRARGANWDPNTRPVIVLHGWSGGSAPAATLAGNMPVPGGGALPIDALLATGRTVYYVFTGDNFGHGTITSPSVGGTGTAAVAAISAQAVTDGLTFTEVDLIGGSMGACNAINWATRNPTLVNRIYAYVPAIEFSSLYDLGGGIQACLLGVYGGADKAAFMTASAAYDPFRIDLSNLAGKVTVLASNPDALIRYAGVTAWCATWGYPLVTTSSNHFTLDDSAFDELSVLRWLA